MITILVIIALIMCGKDNRPVLFMAIDTVDQTSNIRDVRMWQRQRRERQRERERERERERQYLGSVPP